MNNDPTAENKVERTGAAGSEQVARQPPPSLGEEAGPAGAEAATAGGDGVVAAGQIVGAGPEAEVPIQEVQSAEPPAVAAMSEVVMQARDVKAERVNFTGQVFDHSTRIYTSDPRARSRLSAAYFQVLEAPQLERAASDVVADATAVEEMIGRLEGRRFLIVAGEPRLGKTSFAILLADRLLGRHQLAEAMICRHRLEPDLQVPIAELTGKDEAFGARVLILEDALAAGNSDLLRFLRGLDSLALEAVVRDLQRSRSFVILTSNAQLLEERLSQRLARLGVLAHLEALPSERLAEHLRRRAERLPWVITGGDGEIGCVRAFLAEHGGEIVARLRTPPRIEDFLMERLASLVRGELPLEAALSRVDDLAPWLLNELPEDFVAWGYVLTLTLCGAPPRSGTIPWLPFETLRKRLTCRLRRELATDDKERSVREICRDEALLATASAQVQPPGSFRSGAVRFEDPARAALLWEILLKSGRTLLGLLLPLFFELLESPQDGLQAIAAQVLGRIGELDRENITLALLAKQLGMATRELNHCEIIGDVLQGALGSADTSYREFAIGVIERAASGRQPAEAGPEPAALAAVQTVAAILSLHQVARADPAVSLRVLRGAAESWLVEPLQDLGALTQRLMKAERYFRAQEAAGWKGRPRQRLQDLAMNSVPSLFRGQKFQVFVALKLTLADLCTPERLSRVLTDLLDWRMGTEVNPLGALAALFFLELDGIADHLTGDPEPAENGDGTSSGPTFGGALLQWLSPPVTEEVEILARYLSAVHRQIAFYPGLLRHALRQRWLALLGDWLETAAVTDRVRPLVVDLVSRLLPTEALRVDEMGRELSVMIQQLQAVPGTLRARLARDILAHTPVRSSPHVISLPTQSQA
jgi:hypothetical protein